jgi:hypothetical protein
MELVDKDWHVITYLVLNIHSVSLRHKIFFVVSVKEEAIIVAILSQLGLFRLKRTGHQLEN